MVGLNRAVIESLEYNQLLFLVQLHDIHVGVKQLFAGRFLAVFVGLYLHFVAHHIGKAFCSIRVILAQYNLGRGCGYNRCSRIIAVFFRNLVQVLADNQV